MRKNRAKRVHIIKNAVGKFGAGFKKSNASNESGKRECKLNFSYKNGNFSETKRWRGELIFPKEGMENVCKCLIFVEGCFSVEKF